LDGIHSSLLFVNILNKFLNKFFNKFFNKIFNEFFNKFFNKFSKFFESHICLDERVWILIWLKYGRAPIWSSPMAFHSWLPHTSQMSRIATKMSLTIIQWHVGNDYESIRYRSIK
jgi:hypothetical protein